MESSRQILGLLERLEPTDAFFALVAGHGADVVAVGGFRALLSRVSDRPSLNSALPVGNQRSDEEVLADLGSLRRLFAERRRTPVVEFNEPLWPRLPALLERAGFAEREREPLMLCTPGSFRPFASSAVAVRFLGAADDDADLIAYRSIYDRIVAGEGWEPTRAAVAAFRAEVRQSGGRSHALAWLDGDPVGTGFISSSDGVCELTRVATLPEARRRGVAATLTSFMVRDRFDHGDTLAWLTAADENAQAVYLKLGFQVVGERLFYWG